MSRSALRHCLIAIVTILAIVGTLSSCGRYGNPVRVAPAAEVDDSAGVTNSTEESTEESTETSTEESAEEPSDRSSRKK
jgi:hypothetical protein